MKRGSKKVPEERSREKLEDYKKEFRRIKKENEQLRKELRRAQNRDVELKELYEEFEEVAQVEEPVMVRKPSCPKCHSYDVTLLEKLRGNVDYYDCNTCGARGQYRVKVSK